MDYLGHAVERKRRRYQSMACMQVPLPSTQLSLEELVPPRIATQVIPDYVPDVDMSPSSPDAASKAADAGDTTASGASHLEALHFFGVFDGQVPCLSKLYLLLHLRYEAGACMITGHNAVSSCFQMCATETKAKAPV